MGALVVAVVLALVVRWLWRRENVTGGYNEESGILALVLIPVIVLLVVFGVF